MANSLIVGYTTNDESRPQRGKLFPFVDILKDGTVYTSFGFEPFTPNNELRYHTLPGAGQLHLEHAANHTFTFGGTRRALPLRQRVLPGLAERLRLQLARRLLHRRERLPGEPEPHDLAGHAGRFQVRYNNIPGQDEAAAAARRVVRRRSTPRTSGRRARNFRVTLGVRADVSVLRRHRLHERQRRRAHVPRRDRQPGPVRDRQAAGREDPLVAARRLQLGRRGQPQHAAPRRHGRLHRPAALRLDLQPGRQHRRAHRASSRPAQHEGAPVEPEPRRLQAHERHRRAAPPATSWR